MSAILGVLFALFAAVYVVTGHKARRLRSAAPATQDVSRVADPDVWDPYEMALLAGGKRRLGEVVLAKLYLDGLFRVRRRGRRYLTQARLEATAGSDPRGHADADNAAVAAAIKAVGSRGFRYPADVMAATAREETWTRSTLARLRGAGLLLPAKQLRRLERWRTGAAGVQSVTVFPLAAMTLFSVMLVTADLVEAGLPLYIGVPLFLLTMPVLILALRWSGVPAVVIAVSAVAAAYLVVPDVPVWVSVAGLIFGAVWLGTYSIHRATRRSLGARSPAGDALLAATRSHIGERTGAGRRDALLLVALYGLSMLHVSVGGGRRSAGEPALGADHPDVAELGAFAAACGLTGGADVRRARRWRCRGSVRL
ncbi:TIGR04222 domain-containing membrane protein [Phytoactinopolyspora halotolerans]|uniref:TIGR04222 domain-containing membrane protein n=1 Tax=Phytoactinopolyspora halotolerans TaxID=1981512 RepID=A0A6L9SGT3_9ACTN|nr:TIGR04222 domain-containing membrane protein [Phytoactinopolyspora halotolerans]NEE04347.1 TIGR04222 domain-containing membrane protein [Phytoactinopolyspora halotolerans]